MILAALLVVFFSIPVAGICGSAFYFRDKYFEISERMHNAIPLIDEGKYEEAREILSDH